MSPVPGADPVRTMDLRGVGCPLNYVKIRVALDAIDEGQSLAALLDHGEPEENVPRSADEDGFSVLEVVDLGDHVRVVVRR